jgi:hypothetical protein
MKGISRNPADPADDAAGSGYLGACQATRPIPLGKSWRHGHVFLHAPCFMIVF